ncbi:MAG: hypothetical protein HFJ66_02920 [Eggerthellaceae bacterium]|nr:hypothetical protein [Eggerthellaceae bacterium]
MSDSTVNQSGEAIEEQESGLAIPGTANCELLDASEEGGVSEGDSDTVKPPLYKRWWVWAIVVVSLIVVAVATAAAYLAMDRATLPDVAGLSISEAQNAIAEVSENWNVELSFLEDADGVELTSENTADYEVKLTDPQAGETLSKSNNDQVIVLQIGKTQETLDREKAEAEAAAQAAQEAQEKRQAYLQKQLEHSLENGFESGTYEDLGEIVVFNLIGNVDSFGYQSPRADYANPGYKQNIDNCRSAADELGASVLFCHFTRDGYLHQCYVARDDNADEDQIIRVNTFVSTLVEEDEKKARSKQQEWLERFASDLEKDVDDWHAVEVTLAENRADMFVYVQGTGSRYWTGTPTEVQEVKNYYQEVAKTIAFFTKCPASLQFFSRDYIPFSDGQQFVSDYDFNPIVEC